MYLNIDADFRCVVKSVFNKPVYTEGSKKMRVLDIAAPSASYFLGSAFEEGGLIIIAVFVILIAAVAAMIIKMKKDKQKRAEESGDTENTGWNGEDDL